MVGVDSSQNSGEALRWAVSFASAGDVVELVHVWSGPGASDGAEADARMARELYDIADEVLEDEDRELVDLQFTVMHGHAADVLVERSAGVDLLVVGRRGIGGFQGLLIGSVSDDVVQLASCPVAVTPPRDRE